MIRAAIFDKSFQPTSRNSFHPIIISLCRRSSSSCTAPSDQPQHHDSHHASVLTRILQSKSVNDRIRILEQNIQDLATTIDTSNSTKDSLQNSNNCTPIFLSTQFFNTHVMKKWKQSQLFQTQENCHEDALIAPWDLLKKLRDWNFLYPSFQYDVVTIGIILDVLLHQQQQQTILEQQSHHPHQRNKPPTGPLLAEQMLEFVRNEHIRTQSSLLQPNAYLYTQVIQAWAISGHPQAETSIQKLYQTMTTTPTSYKSTTTATEHIQPTLVTYNILMRFYAEQKNIAQMEHYLQTILSSASMSPDFQSWASVLHGYALAGDLVKSKSAYNRLIQLLIPSSTSTTKHHISKKKQILLYKAVLDMLHMYRTRIHKDPQSKTRLHLEAAEKLVEHIDQAHILDSQQMFQLYVSLMDLCARVGNLQKVKTILQKPEFQQPNNRSCFPVNTVTANVLIKAYGKAQQADLAVQLVKDMIKSQSHETRPNITTFNTLLNALAESDTVTTTTSAFEIFQFLDKDCKQSLGLESNIFTFAALLKCLSRSVDPNAGHQAEEILNEMLYRSEQIQDKSIRPNEVCYTLAIRACLSCGDIGRAEAILHHLEISQSRHLGPRTYATILQFYYSTPSPYAPAQAEHILKRMRHVAQTYPKVYPNVNCYNLVLAIWSRHHNNVEEAADAMWKLFLQMQDDGEKNDQSIFPDVVTYTTLLTFYTRYGIRQRNSSWIQKADTLLHLMERDALKLPLSVEHYQMVMDGWLVLEDVARATGVLLRRARACVNVPELAPTAASIQKVLQGWIYEHDHSLRSKNGNPLVRATVLLEELEEWKEKAMQQQQENNHPDDHRHGEYWTGPDVRNYETLLSAWQKSRHPKRNQYVETIQAKIMVGIKPNNTIK